MAAADRDLCDEHGGKVLDEPGRRLEQRGYTVEWTLRGCLIEPEPGLWRLDQHVALGASAMPPNRRLLPRESAHAAFLAAGDRLTAPDAPRDLPSIRDLLRRDAERARARGTIGDRDGTPERLVSIEIGTIEPDGRCFPRTLVTERTQPGTGAVTALFGVHVPWLHLRNRVEQRICVGPQGQIAVLAFGETVAMDDPEAEARGAPVREAAARFFRSLAFRP